MLFRSLLLLLLSLSFFSPIKAYTINDPYKITWEMFEDAEMGHQEEVEDKQGNVYRVFNQSYRKGLEIKVNGNWVKHGKEFGYDTSKKFIERETEFTYGKRDGLEILYHSKGKKKSEINYSEGELDGSYILYWELKGSSKVLVSKKGEYKMGKKNGVFTKYFDNGQPEWTKEFSNGKPIGQLCQWNRDGTEIPCTKH